MAKHRECACDNASRNRSFPVAGARPGIGSKTEGVDLLCPAQGEGTDKIHRHFDLRIRRLGVIQDEILTAHHPSGEEKEVCKLTKLLTQRSPLFKAL